ncbi:UMP kinase [Thermoproteota archaeon]
MPSQSSGKGKRIVLKLSGSLFGPEIEKSDLKPFIKIFTDLERKGTKIVLVAGGGKIARQYIEAARNLGADESTLDEVGIITSRLNAMVLVAGLGSIVNQSIPTSLGEVAKAFEQKNLVVTGGLHPGQSTNATACLIAERVGADLFVNATSVDGVYTSNPKNDPSAEKLLIVTTDKMRDILSDSVMGAGTYELMDLVALKIIERSHIPTRLVLCSPQVLLKALQSKNVGTQISSR